MSKRQGIATGLSKRGKKAISSSTSPNGKTPEVKDLRRKSRWVLLLLLVLLAGGGLAAMSLLDRARDLRKGVDWAALRAKKAKLLKNIPDIKVPEGMVRIPAGKFHMGANFEKRFQDALPVHEVELDEYWIDKTEVTNADFARFVKATGYVTVAEKEPNPKEFPGVKPEELAPFSLVFTPPKDPDTPVRGERDWWSVVYGACWYAPEGPDSTIADRWDHPVVQVCYHDAVAYAKWAKKRLPTEAEWERAARGGLDRKKYMWGDKLLPDEKWQSNIWQGKFPWENEKQDGHIGTAAVGSFPANGFGIYDMSGNVWEWCSDWYRGDYYEKSPKKNPQGPKDSFDPHEPTIPKKVQRGGSFLCSDGFCIRYLPAGRGKGDLNSGASHIGFRCARSASK